MEFMEKRKEQLGIKSLGDLRRSGKFEGTIDETKFVKGPKNIDCNVRPWHRGDLTGILAGAGTGKTSYTLHILKHILLNNPEGIVAFVSLEMTASEIYEKWCKSTQDHPELSDRFYIIENYDDSGRSRELNANDIKFDLLQLRSALNTKVHAFVVDHLHEINLNGGLDYNPVCKTLKNIAVELDSHGFILSQTTKGKGVGDIPVPKDGCYGTSRYEWLMTNIITIFQPLLRVQKESNLPILGWQYAKIRYKNVNDKVKENMNYLLKFNFDTEDLEPLSSEDKAKFQMYYEKVLDLRQNEEKFKSYQFDLSEYVKGKDGREVKINKVYGGYNPEDI